MAHHQARDSSHTIATPGGSGRLTLGELAPFFDEAKVLLTRRSPLRASDVFINIPYDLAYQPVAEAIVFTTLACGYRPRLAVLGVDSSQTRLERIAGLLTECPLSIHDLTSRRTQTGEARLNMAFELGMAVGSARAARRRRSILVLDEDRYRLQMAISDINGLEVSPHSGKPRDAISAVRRFLRSHNADTWAPSDGTLTSDLARCRADVRRLRVAPDQITHPDWLFLMCAWLIQKRRSRAMSRR
jgi:hypothetical protein